MRRTLVVLAAVVVAGTNGWILVSAWGNRSEARGGAIQLTERELRLPFAMGESTVLWLELEWDSLSVSPDHRRMPKWLDAAKLQQLGFDCQVALTDPGAGRHYRSLRAAMVYFVFEFEGDAWKEAPADRKRQTRLFVVDAGRVPERLRETYSDSTRYVVMRGLVSVVFQSRGSDGKPLTEPRLSGRIGTVFPEQIFVSRPHVELLADLRERLGPTRDQADGKPRYVAAVSWGRNYEPWVSGVERIE